MEGVVCLTDELEVAINVEVGLRYVEEFLLHRGGAAGRSCCLLGVELLPGAAVVCSIVVVEVKGLPLLRSLPMTAQMHLLKLFSIDRKGILHGKMGVCSSGQIVKYSRIGDHLRS
ncbi:hypothetical protein KSP40_PGU002761 [Platanthera guangdongensis]|uniref:Uncharacterized protein n=1 Tax=Platanthera guangdongensis TaxID=2320717 RepID=A0ABR2MAW8_9ASPA